MAGDQVEALGSGPATSEETYPSTYGQGVLRSVTTTPHRSLERVLDHLGDTLLERLAGDTVHARAIGGVTIHDPADDLATTRRSIVLGVGVHDHDDICQLLRDLGQSDAAALVVRTPLTVTGEMRRTAERAGVALLGLTAGAAWTQLAAMLRTLLTEDDASASVDLIGGIASGDLFSLANAIAALLDAPITIEDCHSNVLAFSGRQDEADAQRIETILGRKVPDRYVQEQESRGEFDQIHRADGPVFLPSLALENDEHAMARVAIAVRAGQEILGSIWVAVPEPLDPERNAALADAAKLVALHLLRVRAGSDVERRLRADLLSTALEGGPSAAEAAGRLGIIGRPVMVFALALEVPDPEGAQSDVAAHATQLQRAADAFGVHLTALQQGAAVAVLGDRAYGTVPVTVDAADPAARARRMAQAFLDRIGRQVPALIGIGPLAGDVAALPTARQGADRALRVLRHEAGSRRVATSEDVLIDSLLLDLADLAAARREGTMPEIARLLDYDLEHQAQLVDTLRAWLDCFGDLPAAAARMYVHPNTYRYRIRRVSEVSGLDLKDPRQRFAAMVQLRLLDPQA